MRDVVVHSHQADNTQARWISNLTPLIPLPFKGEGEIIFEGVDRVASGEPHPLKLPLINNLCSKGLHPIV